MAIKDIRFKISVDSSEVKEATKALQAQGGEAKELKQEFDNVNSAANKANKEIESGATKAGGSLKGLGGQIKDHARDINVFGVNAGRAFDTFDGGIGKAVKGLNLFKLALASTGIGLLVVAIGGLVAYFTKTEKGVEQLERVFARFRAGVDVIIGRFANLGSGIVDIFSGNILKGVETLKSTFTGMGDEISKASKLAGQFTEELQDIEDAEKALRLEISKSVNQRQLLFIQAKNTALTQKESTALLEKAAKIEIDIVNKQIALQERKVKALNDENNLKLKSGEIDKGNKTDALNDAENELEQLRGNSLELLARFQNKESAILKKGNKGKRDTNQSSYEVELDFLNRHLDDKLEATKENGEKSLEEIEKINRATELEMGATTSYTTDAQALELRMQLENFEDNEKEKTRIAKEQAATRQQIERAATQLAFEVANGLFEIASNRRDAELMDIQSKKEQELSIAGDNKQKQAAINAKYAQQERAIKIKQAQSDKEQALFNIALNTAIAVSKAAPNPYLIALALGIGLVQAAVVSFRPIPKFNKGTKSVQGIDTGDDSVLAMVRPKEGIMPVDRMNDYQPAFDAIFDRKVPAELMNGLAMNYGKMGKAVTNGGHQSSSLDTDRIIKAIEKKQETHINIDKKGIKTYIKSGFAETEITNNYFAK